MFLASVREFGPFLVVSCGFVVKNNENECPKVNESCDFHNALDLLISLCGFQHSPSAKID